MNDDLHALIEKAVKSGRVTRLEQGATSVQGRAAGDVPARMRPEHCGCGNMVSRSPRLDELDGERP